MQLFLSHDIAYGSPCNFHHFFWLHKHQATTPLSSLLFFFFIWFFPWSSEIQNMQALSPSPNLKSLIRTRPLVPTHRVAPHRLVVQCVYKSDYSNFSGGVGFSRADWQSSCAILASKVVSQQQDTEKSGNADLTAVNGHKTLDLRIRTARRYPFTGIMTSCFATASTSWARSNFRASTRSPNSASTSLARPWTTPPEPRST
ncbi:unnamed protein product, partial [Vitis vinifera]